MVVELPDSESEEMLVTLMDFQLEQEVSVQASVAQLVLLLVRKSFFVSSDFYVW